MENSSEALETAKLVMRSFCSQLSGKVMEHISKRKLFLAKGFEEKRLN